jgi:hypothetical protein
LRYLAYLLLLANLGLFAWMISQPAQQPPEYRPIPVPPGIESLVLLSERAADPADKVAAAESAVPEDSIVAEGGQQLRTVSTAPAAATGEQATAARQATQEGNPKERICRTVGPLLRKNEANTLARQLETRGYDTSLRGGEVREPSGYWVYMPAMPAREARRIVAELDANGMKDYFIGKQNYISLGIFSRKDKAQTRLEQIEKLGFDAVLDQRYRTRNVYWLDLEEDDQPLLGSEIWQQIQAEHTDIRVQRVSCE